MESSKYLIAGGTTNWVEGLAAYYAKDEEKRRRHGEALKQRDAAALKVQAAESPIKALEGLSKLSVTVGKLAQQQKKIAAQNEQSERLEADVLLTKNIKADEWEEINRITRESVNDLKFEGALFKKNILASKSLSEAAKKTLTAQHGSSIYRIHEQIGYRSLSTLDSAIEAYGATDEGKAFQLELDQIRGSGDHIAEKALYKRFAFQQFNKLGFNDKFIAANFSKPLDKFISSKGVMAQLMYQKVHHTEQELDFTKRTWFAKNLYDNGDEFALTNEFHQQLTEVNHDKDRLVNHYYRLAKSGGLNLDEIRAIRLGDLDSKLGFKAGSTGDDLLSSEQWARIESGVLEHSKSIIASNQKQNENNVINATGTILKGEGSVDDLIQLKDATELAYLRSGGNPDNDTFKIFQKLDPTKQSPGSYKETIQEWMPYISGQLRGSILQAETSIKALPNQAASKQLLQIIDEDKQYYSLVGMPTTFKEQQTYSKGLIRNSDVQKKAKIFGPQDKLVGEAGEIQTYLTQQRVLSHAIARRKYEDPLEAYEYGEDLFSAHLDKHGFNTIDDGSGNIKIGKLSATIDGKYKRWNPYKDAEIHSERNRIGSKENSYNWTQGYVNANLHFKGDKDRILDTSESMLEQSSLLNMVVHNKLDDQGRLIPTYTPELIHKASLMRVSPGELLRRQLTAFVNHPENADIVKSLGLQVNYLDKLYTPDIDLKKALVTLGNKKLLYKYNLGPDKLTYNDIIEMQNSLAESVRGQTIGVQNLPENYAGQEIRFSLKAQYPNESKEQIDERIRAEIAKRKQVPTN